MNRGDMIYIRNRTGKLAVELAKPLAMEDVATGVGCDAIVSMSHPRLEYHAGQNGRCIVTLCDKEYGLPGMMYVIFIEPYDAPEAWLGRFDEDEECERVYETQFGDTPY